MDGKFTIGVLVLNRAGVLLRCVSLFARRGFNIDSLTVSETENRDFSRMTIVASGGEYEKDQIVKQLLKLVDVKNVVIMERDEAVYRELLLIKVASEAGRRSEILEGATIYRASVVDLTPHALTIELTGDTRKIDAFIEYLRPYGIIEQCRTGVSAIERGNSVLADGKVKYYNGKDEN